MRNKVIDSPVPAKLSAGHSVRDRVRSLDNELARVRRRHKRATEKLAGLRSLKDDLPRYLQPGDYGFLEVQLTREADRRRQEEEELCARISDARHALRLAQARWRGLVYGAALRSAAAASDK